MLKDEMRSEVEKAIKDSYNGSAVARDAAELLKAMKDSGVELTADIVEMVLDKVTGIERTGVR